MAITGLIFVLFVLFHMYGNLKMFMGADAFNHYAHFLQNDLLYPILPHKGGVWLLRVTLLVCIILHVYCAVTLWARGKAGRGNQQYKVNAGPKKKQSQSYVVYTMRYGGVLILVWLVFHLLQFTALKIQVGGDYHAMEPYERFVASFSAENWWVWLFYLLAICALALHVQHGVFSALATLGLDRREREVAFKAISHLCAFLLIVGFMAPPTAVLLGLLS